jgi:alpha-tubulin suppressor-like RCC1 family protein
VVTWGLNIWGQLGNGTTSNAYTPVAVDMSGALSGKTVSAIAAGAEHTVALTSDGKVFACTQLRYQLV